MIVGVGTDMANIERIGRTLDKFGERFRTRVFTRAELDKADSRANSPKTYIATLAKRWAAKEATSKALGTGIAMGVSWKDISVSNLDSGQPIVTLSGWALERATAMVPAGHRPVVHLSLSDDHPWAQAFVVLEARVSDANLRTA